MEEKESKHVTTKDCLFELLIWTVYAAIIDSTFGCVFAPIIGLVLITICCIVSYMMSGDFSLYGVQILNHPNFRNR